MRRRILFSRRRKYFAESLKDKRYFAMTQLYCNFGDKGIVDLFYRDDDTVDVETTKSVFDSYWYHLVYTVWAKDSKYGGCLYNDTLNYQRMISNLRTLTENC